MTATNANRAHYAFLIDLDGTMYAGGSPIPHAAEFIRKLKQRSLPYLFVTNNSSRTPEAVADHLCRLGIEAEANEVVTSAQATARYVSEQRRGHRVYVIGEDGLRTALTEAGLELVEDRPDFVVQGIDREFSYRKLEAAVGFVASGAEYVLTNPDRLLPSDGRLAPGAGAISGSIQAALQIAPIVIGKPSARIMQFALERLNGPSEVWAVGDNPSTDIGAGHAAGLRTALVCTGIATPLNVTELLAKAPVKPDLVCRDLSELLQRLHID